MNKKIITGIVLSTMLASGLFAFSQDTKGEGHKKNFKKHHSMNKEHKMPFFSTLKKIYLSAKQKEEIKKIMHESMQKKHSLLDAFTSTSFDKNKYLSLMKAKKENMLESKANVIEKVYAVLNKQQKEELKKRLDDKKERMSSRHNKRLNNDKDTNG